MFLKKKAVEYKPNDIVLAAYQNTNAILDVIKIVDKDTLYVKRHYAKSKDNRVFWNIPKDSIIRHATQTEITKAEQENRTK